MVAERRRKEAGRWEAGNGWWKESDLARTWADPVTRVDGIVAEGRRCWSHVKAPWIGTEARRRGGEFGATVEVGRKSNEKDEAGELELRR